ncbi:MAG: hypothetical protein RRY69_04640, partial [Oscillospiraceae bacterium]
MKKKNKLFTSAIFGFDKEEVLLYLSDLINAHTAKKAELENELGELKANLEAAVRSSVVTQCSSSSESGKQDAMAVQFRQVKTALDSASAENEQLKKTYYEQNAQMVRLHEEYKKAVMAVRSFQNETERLRAENDQLKQSLSLLSR